MRLEYKYLINNEYLDAFRDDISPFVCLDKYAEKERDKEYTVRSIYLDTIELCCYHEKNEGMSYRKKFRIRGYNNCQDSSIIFLEIKRKYINRVTKNRAPLHYTNMEELLQSGNISNYVVGEKGSHDDASRFLHNFNKSSLVPTVLVVYNREAYYSQFYDDLRITFDKQLRYKVFPSYGELYNEEILTTTMKDKTIVEIKFSKGFPGWMRYILKKYHLSRMSVSKYAICLDSERDLNLARRKTSIGLIN